LGLVAILFAFLAPLTLQATSLERSISIQDIEKWTSGAEAAGSEAKTLFNFGKTAGEHMLDPARKVPIQIMDDVIKNTKGLPDPKGSNALMYYSTMFKNGKQYNLEVLFDKASNSIWHFQYSPKALGPLPAIK
jgi:hypothetical protein